MDAGVAHAALQDPCGLQGLALEGGLLADGLELLDLGKPLASDLFFEGLVLEAEHLLQGDVGHEFGQTVGVAQRQFHDARGVPDGRLRRHGAVGDDLGHLVRTVLVDHVVDDLSPAFVVEVNVDVGQTDTVRIQEPLEEQVVLDGVHIGDGHAIRHGRPCRRPTPRPHTDPHLSGGRGEVLDDQEIARVARAFNRCQLKVDALPNGIRHLAVALLRPFVGDVPQVGILPPLPAILGILLVDKFLGDVKCRQQHIPLQGVPFALGDDPFDVGDRLRHIRKEGLHFLGRLQIERVVGEAKPEFAAALAHIPFGLADVAGVLDAKQDVVCLALVLAGVVTVVAGHQLDVVLGGQTLQHAVDHLFFLQSMAVQLRIEVVAHHGLPGQECFLSLGLSHIQNERRHLSKKPAREHHQIFFEGLHKGPVNPWHVVETLRVGL